MTIIYSPHPWHSSVLVLQFGVEGEVPARPAYSICGCLEGAAGAEDLDILNFNRRCLPSRRPGVWPRQDLGLFCRRPGHRQLHGLPPSTLRVPALTPPGARPLTEPGPANRAGQPALRGWTRPDPLPAEPEQPAGSRNSSGGTSPALRPPCSAHRVRQRAPRPSERPGSASGAGTCDALAWREPPPRSSPHLSGFPSSSESAEPAQPELPQPAPSSLPPLG